MQGHNKGSMEASISKSLPFPSWSVFEEEMVRERDPWGEKQTWERRRGEADLALGAAISPTLRKPKKLRRNADVKSRVSKLSEQHRGKRGNNLPE